MGFFVCLGFGFVGFYLLVLNFSFLFSKLNFEVMFSEVLA